MIDVKKELEINKILAIVAFYSKTFLGKRNILKSNLLKNADQIKFELERLKDFKMIYDRTGDFPISAKLDFASDVKKIQSGTFYDEIHLNYFKDDLISLKELTDFIFKNGINSNILNPTFKRLKFINDLYVSIQSTIAIDNTILSSASPKLALIRQNIDIQKKNLKAALDRTLNFYSEKISSNSFALKDGHYALPVNSSFKNSIDGIVLDVSDSGLTTFIVPKDILNIENNIHVLEIEEKNEINAILQAFSLKILENKEQLLLNYKTIEELDVLQSKVKYAIANSANFINLSSKKVISLYNAKHPLIDNNKCVANDFILNGEKSLMLISGPNAGGKTVALKTIATCVYLTNMGFPIKASADSEIGYFNRIFIDIGDSQSIESNLSTFSAHIKNISSILRVATVNDLFFIDELCNGTDPKEGESLAIAICKFLIKNNYFAFITSHFSELKKFGLNNSKILNASFIFNESKMLSTYKIALGVSGKSYGLLIAKKYGLPRQIIDDANNIISENYFNNQEIKLEKIEQKERDLLLKREQYNADKAKLDEENKNLQKRINDLDQKELNLKEKKLDELDDYINDIHAKADDILKNIKKDSSLKDIDAKIDNLLPSNEDNFEVGDYAIIKSLDSKGKIVQVRGNKCRVVDDTGFNIEVNKKDLKKIPTPKLKPKSTINIDNEILNRKQVSSSLNLIGYHIDEGIAALDLYLDSCYQLKVKNVKIIHGYGTGKLREAIHAYLKKSKIVESFRLGNELDGGTGATIVTLK